MRLLFVMDPFDRINVAGDSTYAMMCEATARGHEVFACVPNELYALDGRARARVLVVSTHADAPHFRVHGQPDVDLATMDVVFQRKDPPFDMTYILACYLLDLIPPPTVVLNRPDSLIRFNEKLWAMRFTSFHPHTLLSRDKERVVAFVENLRGPAVLKPWDGNGGRGVVVTEAGDRNLRSLVELLTQEGHAYVIAQRYIPGIAKGDKRILLLDGEPVGAVLRVPGPHDHRGNIHVGATVEASPLTDREREICDALGPELRANGLFFVGIDVIDGFLTEINVTSPTGIQEANRLYGLRLEADLMDRLEAKVAAARVVTRPAGS